MGDFDSRERHRNEAYDSANFYLVALIGRDYNHNFALNRQNRDPLQHDARVYALDGGREMVMLTTGLSLQRYSRNFLNSSMGEKSGRGGHKNPDLALGSQHCPDSPPQPDFLSTILRLEEASPREPSTGSPFGEHLKWRPSGG